MSKELHPATANSGLARVSRTVTADLEQVLEQYDHDYDQVPARLIHLGEHWSAIFNPNVPRETDVELVKQFEPHESCPLMDVSFSPDGRYLAARSCGGAHIWDVQQDWRKIDDFYDSPTSDRGFGGESESVHFSPDSRLIATGGEEGHILVWDVESRSRKHRISGHDGGVRALAFSNDGKVLASSGGDNTVCLWNVESADLIKKFDVGGVVLGVTWSPDGNLLAASSGHDVIIWDVGTKSVLGRFETKSQGRSSLIASLVFSPNGKMLITGHFYGWIKVWSLEDGIPDREALLLQLRGQEEVVCSLAVTPDNRWLLSGSKHRDLVLWDLQSGDAQVLVSAFANSVTGVDVSTKGDLIATSCGDGKIRIFSYSPYTSAEPEVADKVLYTPRSLRGLDMPLGHFPGHHFPIMTGNAGDWLSPTLSIRELCMLKFMDEITDKPDWWAKVHDADIAGRWKAEALDAEWDSYRRYGDFTSAMADACIAELREKAKVVQECGFVLTFDYATCVIKSDSMMDDTLASALKSSSLVLEQGLQGKGWHPGSDGKVLDLVHPSICPLVYGKSRVLTPGQVVPRDTCVSMMGAGQVIPEPGVAARKGVRAYNHFSTRFQWLPADVLITNGKVKIDSYINNLHPQEHPGIYSIVETLIEKALPAWDVVYRWPDEFAHQRLVVESAVPECQTPDICQENYECRPSNRPLDTDEEPRSDEEEDDEDEDEELSSSYDEDAPNKVPKRGETLETDEAPQSDDMEESESSPPDDDDAAQRGESDPKADRRMRDSQWWEQTHPLRLPNPTDAGFARGVKPDDVASSQFFLHRGKGTQRIQVIVKLANIHLSPEKPAYDGGSWHVEGLLNEHICATALFYYDNENITDSQLAFRSLANREDLAAGVDYTQNDRDSIQRIFGIDPDGSTLQDIGQVSTRAGRAIFFPNILQHRVSPFRLQDATRPGHRKIVALFLVDPAIHVISTANVPPQQQDWWRRNATHGEGGEGLGAASLPDGLMDSEEAGRIMEELMAERTMHRDKSDHDLRELDWDFCEH